MEYQGKKKKKNSSVKGKVSKVGGLTHVRLFLYGYEVKMVAFFIDKEKCQDEVYEENQQCDQLVILLRHLSYDFHEKKPKKKNHMEY